MIAAAAPILGMDDDGAPPRPARRPILRLATVVSTPGTPQAARARAPREGGSKRFCVPTRFTENELGRADVTALRLGVDRSTLIRQAIELFVQAVDDAWYWASIGGAPCSSVEALLDRVRALMTAEAEAALQKSIGQPEDGCEEA
jgi:hypothetical protein